MYFLNNSHLPDLVTSYNLDPCSEFVLWCQCSVNPIATARHVGCRRSDDFIVALYFTSYMLIVMVVIMNLVLAVLIDEFLKVCVFIQNVFVPEGRRSYLFTYTLPF